MTDAPGRFLRLSRDGTAAVPLQPDELALYEGPTRGHAAVFRVQPVSMADLEAELAGLAETLPWLRDVDRQRAVRDLHRSGADRVVLEHVARTPVAAFGPTNWVVLEVVSGRWETDVPFRTDLLCGEGGAVYDAVLPFGMGPDDVRAAASSIPKEDPRRRERVAVLLGAHPNGLSDD